MKGHGLLSTICVVLFATFVHPAGAQDILPKPEPPFKGKIGRTVKESVPDFPKSPEAPKGAPKILLILTDDVGFGASSTFGGPIQTPTMDRFSPTADYATTSSTRQRYARQPAPR